MHRELLEKAFEKAKEETGSNTITHLSKKLSDEIFEFCNESYGERILRDKYNKIKADSEAPIEIRSFAADALSQYLDFDDFVSFKKSRKNKVKKKLNIKSFWKDYKIAIIISGILIIGFITYNSLTQQRWMVWEKDHYVEVDFEAKKHELKQLKLFKEERIIYFKKIEALCNKTKFFNQDGSVHIWYGKNKDKELQYFTGQGLHPETGKPLKPITQYMIDKHICN